MSPEIATMAHDLMTRHIWAVYLGVFLGPFLQEDAAVLAAASLSMAGMGDSGLVFALIFLGLTASDLWKYWAGRAARTQAWARKFAEKPGVAKAETVVRDRLGPTIMTVRFVPGARIAAYVAAGYFGASWPRFAFWVAFSALIYIALAFALFHLVGMVAGEAARAWLPALALGCLVLYFVIKRFAPKGRKASAGGAADNA